MGRCGLEPLAIGLVVLVAPASRAEDWPNWWGRHHDGISRERGLLASWPAQGPRVLWKAALTGGYSSVAVAGGRPAGTLIKSAAGLLAWVSTTGEHPGTDAHVAAKFVIDTEGSQLLADRRSEHVACAGGGPVLPGGLSPHCPRCRTDAHLPRR
jgi:hypothetical protein